MGSVLQKIKDNKVVVLLTALLISSVSFSLYGGFKMWHSKPPMETDTLESRVDYSGDLGTLDCVKRLSVKYIPEAELNKCVKSQR